MTKNLVKYAFVLFVLSVFSASCASAQIIPNQDKTKDESTLKTVDLSTDETVIAELQKITDERNAKRANGDEKILAKQKAAGKLKKEDVCIERIEEAEIIAIGFFRTDVGCHLDGIFVGSRYFAREESDLSKLALAALGWEKASKSERENLANIWVEKGLLVFAPLSNQSLSAISTGDGNVKVTASSKYPAGVTSRSVSKVFVFNQEGGLESGSGY